jgi:hypothetical protein
MNEAVDELVSLLGTVGRLQAAMARDFTGGMAHAFVASVLICALAVVFSIVREGRRRQRRQRAVAPQAAQAQPADPGRVSVARK